MEFKFKVQQYQTDAADAVRDVFEGQAAATVRYDLVGEVAAAAAITRRSAAALLGGIAPATFALFNVNPEEFILKAGRLMLEQKAAMVVDHITYHATDQEYDSAIFTTRMPESISKAYRARKNVQDYVFPDSAGERKFAEEFHFQRRIALNSRR